MFSYVPMLVKIVISSFTYFPNMLIHFDMLINSNNCISNLRLTGQSTYPIWTDLLCILDNMAYQEEKIPF